MLSENIIKNRLRLDIKSHVTQTAPPLGSGAVDTQDKWAWGPDIGYIDFNPTHGAMAVSTAGVFGHAWSLTGGWINLRPTLTGISNTCAGVLGGSAWSSHMGYIAFGTARIDANGFFQGKATTSSSGNIYFQGAHYKLRTTWKPTCPATSSLVITSPASGAALSASAPTISGHGATFGSTVRVTTSGEPGCVATVSGGGYWSCTIATSVDLGPNTFAATEIGSAHQALQGTSAIVQIR